MVPAPPLDEPERYTDFLVGLVDSSRRWPWHGIEVLDVSHKHFELDGNTAQTLNRVVRLLTYDTTRSESGPGLRLYYGIIDMGHRNPYWPAGFRSVAARQALQRHD